MLGRFASEQNQIDLRVLIGEKERDAFLSDCSERWKRTANFCSDRSERSDLWKRMQPLSVKCNRCQQRSTVYTGSWVFVCYVVSAFSVLALFTEHLLLQVSKSLSAACNLGFDTQIPKKSTRFFGGKTHWKIPAKNHTKLNSIWVCRASSN